MKMIVFFALGASCIWSLRLPGVDIVTVVNTFHDESSMKLEVVRFGAQNGDNVRMKLVDADIVDDRDKTLQHAQSIKSDIQENMKLIYHTVWFGPLNAKTLTSVKSCYYYNVRMAGNKAASDREIWLWVDHIDQAQKDPLYQNFSQYVHWKEYDFEYERVGSPVENWHPRHAVNRKPFMADLARDIFLYKYGGFYFDMDLITLRSWDPLLKEYPDQMLAYAWERQNYPNNAFLYSPAKHPTLLALFNFMMKKNCDTFGFQACKLAYDTDVPLTVLPCRWFDDGWMEGPEKYSSFFADQTETSDWSIPGAFGFHWHNQWDTVIHPRSKFAQFKRKIDALLA